MTWERVVGVVTARHPELTLGKMFGMPCLKRRDGKVVAALWKDGGIMVKFNDEKARGEALSLAGAAVGRHAFDPSWQMREWIHVPATRSEEWEGLLERALMTFG